MIGVHRDYDHFYSYDDENLKIYESPITCENKEYSLDIINDQDICFVDIKKDYKSNFKNKNNLIVLNQEDDYIYSQVKKYFKDISRKYEDIELVIKRMSGMPVIKNSRIPVILILGCLADGMSIDEISEDYDLSESVIIEAIEYSIEVMKKPYYGDDSY